MYCSSQRELERLQGDLAFAISGQHFHTQESEASSWLWNIPCGCISHSPQGSEDMSDFLLRGNSPTLWHKLPRNKRQTHTHTHSHPAFQRRWKMHLLLYLNLAAITCFLDCTALKSYAYSICFLNYTKMLPSAVRNRKDAGWVVRLRPPFQNGRS